MSLSFLELRRPEDIMACAKIDSIIREMNFLLDEQLTFLGGDLHALDSAAWLEYEERYDRIRLLCELLGGQAEGGEPREESAILRA